MHFDPSAAVLILVDLQNDFLPGGALAVAEGDAIVPLANRLQALFDLVIATQDWHPPNHVSFAENHVGKKVGDTIEVDGLSQKLWPVHCVQESYGAALAPEFDTGRIGHRVQKGTDPRVDSYSGFFDNGHRHGTGLDVYLRARGVRTVYLAGLATDFCVKFTALDARRLGFAVVLFEDACRGIDTVCGGVEAALQEMSDAGVEVISTTRLLG